MAELVAGFVMPHVPLILANPEAPSAEQRAVVFGAFEQIAKALADYRIDTVIIIGSDHCSLFGTECLPPCLIGVGDIEGPLEEWLGLAREPIPGNSALARHILDTGFANGVDWAASRNLLVDHAVVVPYQLAVKPQLAASIIPVYLNSGVDPAVPIKRAAHIGRTIGEAIASWPGNERVAILGTGGLSHWVGMAQMGQVNAEWDRSIIALIEQGKIEALLALEDGDVLAAAGNGALEVKNYVCAMSAMAAGSARLIAYEPVNEWICGCAFLELEKKAA